MGEAASKWISPDPKQKEGTKLCEIQVPHIRDAHNVVGLAPESFTPVVIRPGSAATRICCGPCCWTSIPSGFVAVVSRWGASIEGDEKDGSWGPGFHCFWPWHQVDRLVSKQLIVFDSPVKACKTKDNITVHIDVLIVLEIVQAFDFVYNIGPDKFDELLRATQEEILRGMISETTIEEVYDLHGAQTDKWGGILDEQMKAYGIKFHHFTVRNVRIPAEMAQDFEDKTLYESKTLEKKVCQERDRLSLDQAEALLKLREECDNLKMAAEEESLTAQAQLSKETAEMLVTVEKELLLQEGQRKAHIQDIAVSTALEVAKINAQVEDLRRTTLATIENEVGRLEAEAEAYEKNRRSQGKMEASEKTSEGKRVLAEAEGAAAEAFQARRAQEQELRRLDVIERMANNPHVSIATAMENSMGLAPDNSLVTQIAQQGMEALRMKLASMTSECAKKVDMGQVVAGGVVRPVEQQTMR
jgi:regulator of protease activity HflC (stomatin/prohibitin superfamily)